MKVLKWLLIVVVALLVGVIGAGFVLPDTAHVERSVVINARPATVYTVLNGFRQFDKWSPWAGLDPNATYTVEGPLMGVGAKQSWRSDDPSVGAGSQEILESVPNQKIVMALVFEGFASENRASYLLQPEGEATRLLWTYDSTFHGNLLGRYFGLMMDGMLGPDYERGLVALKTLVESLPATDISDLQISLETVDSHPMLYISGSAGPDEARDVLGAIYGRIGAFMAERQLQQAAPPIAITRAYDDETRAWQFDAALLPDRSEVDVPELSEIRLGQTYGGAVLTVLNTGPYTEMETLYTRLTAFREIAGLQDNGDSWEQYLTDPSTTPPQQAQTRVYWPVK
ncbi:hypothetical protein E4T66_08920 [Sinimarinibacterium sp. CAU 1509]|uniref:SRPBCC family protein n=1 Tax=Sinimarinibacterium sp. CAU 1509 TaxID=2562283 RepID=UPI0010AB9ACA|nr:SRPBCC family protein [Sinimarinibacterium sp. CAU 1509]TJY62327.1 hypothetical protein E4T66_08920 [Sinimarinibacterium sp. CAU 1509]